MHVSNRKLALAGIAGTVTYAIADLFLYIGADMLNEDRTKLLSIPEWRLMASMWIAALGSLLMLMGYISLARLFAKAFPKTGKYLILPALICYGGIMDCSYNGDTDRKIQPSKKNCSLHLRRCGSSDTCGNTHK